MNTKISDAAVEAALDVYYAGNPGDGPHELEEVMRASLAAALPHLAADVVPVAWLIHWSNIPLEAPEVTTSASRVDAVSALTGPPRIEPLYTHPQPAALNEVSGNSGELGGDERARFEAWARSKGHDPSVRLMLTSHPPQDGGYANPSLQRLWQAWQAALAATGKQQGESGPTAPDPLTLRGLIAHGRVTANPSQGAVPSYMCSLIGQMVPYLMRLDELESGDKL